MPIVGVGTDVVAVRRFTRLVERGGRRFLDRWFRPAEVEALLAHSEPARHTAARFAAKEAVLKALRVPDIGPVRWQEIEITHGPDGRVGVLLHGSLRGIADTAGASNFQVSMTHAGACAMATVVAQSS